MRVELRPSFTMDTPRASIDVVAVDSRGGEERLANFRPMDQALATEVHAAFVRWADRETDAGEGSKR